MNFLNQQAHTSTRLHSNTMNAIIPASPPPSLPADPSGRREVSVRRRQALREERTRIKGYIETSMTELIRRLDRMRESGTYEEDEPPNPPFPSPVQALLHRLAYPRRSITALKKFTQILRVLEELHHSLSSSRVVTKREIYYHAPVLFGSQSVVDRIVEDLAQLFEVSKRSALGVVAASKGLMAGYQGARVVLDDGNTVELSENRETLVPDMDTVDAIECGNAKWLLVVEKEAVFKTILQSGVASQGVIVTGKGYPDMLTKEFVVRFAQEWPRTPILALVDGDPFGLHIFQQYQRALSAAEVRGSIQLLGLLQGDIDRFSISANDFIPLQPIDRTRAETMLKELDGSDVVRSELTAMLQRGTKAELECLSPQPGLIPYLSTKLSSI